ncbi:unnamed protein product [Protopolystoma xenopodis]|uniref:Uncharacterized protein n=1 Tax=Protopolystoma xenopodis TaxID=117903 RepID=A0A448XSM6_9PLAT|nr:unnamed protein product [Protopolystoma xenopodis]
MNSLRQDVFYRSPSDCSSLNPIVISQKPAFSQVIKRRADGNAHQYLPASRFINSHVAHSSSSDLLRYQNSLDSLTAERRSDVQNDSSTPVYWIRSNQFHADMWSPSLLTRRPQLFICRPISYLALLQDLRASYALRVSFY